MKILSSLRTSRTAAGARCNCTYVCQIGYVGQEPVLFAGTIGLNIANGKQGVTTQDESEKKKKKRLLPVAVGAFWLYLDARPEVGPQYLRSPTRPVFT